MGHALVVADTGQQVSDAGRRLSDLGSFCLNFRHGADEDGEGLAFGQRSRRGEDGIEAISASSGSKFLGDCVVVAGEVVDGDAQVSAHRRAREVQHIEVDGDAANSAPYFERIDAIGSEVAEQFGPRGLFLIGRVPDAGVAVSVVATCTDSGISARREGESRRSLMPPPTGEPSMRCGGDRVGEAQT